MSVFKTTMIVAITVFTMALVVHVIMPQLLTKSYNTNDLYFASPFVAPNTVFEKTNKSSSKVIEYNSKRIDAYLFDPTPILNCDYQWCTNARRFR